MGAPTPRERPPPGPGEGVGGGVNPSPKGKKGVGRKRVGPKATHALKGWLDFTPTDHSGPSSGLSIF